MFLSEENSKDTSCFLVQTFTISFCKMDFTVHQCTNLLSFEVLM